MGDVFGNVTYVQLLDNEFCRFVRFAVYSIIVFIFVIII